MCPSSSSGCVVIEKKEKKKKKTMGRGRIEIKKIENVSSRQVTFSKRRTGLIKKAKELAILCDAEVGVIIFSSTGKLYEFASSRLSHIIARYERSSVASENATAVRVPEITKQEFNSEAEALKAEVTKLRKMQRLMMGKELEGLSFKELEHLERQLQHGMLTVKNHKERALMEEIKQTKIREQKVLMENEALKKQIAELQNKSISNAESRLVGKKSLFLNPNVVAYRIPENEDVEISLHLGLSAAVEEHQKRKIPKIESDP